MTDRISIFRTCDFAMELALLVNLLAAGIRSGTPILFATIGEIFAERSGVLNLGVEGMMLMGAMTGYGVSYGTGNAWIGLLAAIGVGGLMALLHAFVTVTLRADQVVSGLALTFLGDGHERRARARRWWRCAPRPGCPPSPIPVPFTDPDVRADLLSTTMWSSTLGFLLIPDCVVLHLSHTAGAGTARHRRVSRGCRHAGHQRHPSALFLCHAGRDAGGHGRGLAEPGHHAAVDRGHDRRRQGWIAVGLVIFAGWDPDAAAHGRLSLWRDSPAAAGCPESALLSCQNPTLGYFMNMLPYLFTIFVLILVIGSMREAMRRRRGRAYVRKSGALAFPTSAE